MTRKLKNDRVMSHKDIAQQLWIEEGKKGKPLTKQGIAGIERRILLKFKMEIRKQGFTQIDVYQYLDSLGDQNNYAEVEYEL